VAALILTHNLSALLFSPFLALYLVLRAGALRSGAALIGGASMLLGGVLLSAFYWLPAVAEFPGVRQGSVPLNPQDFLNQLYPPVGLVAADLPYRYYPDQISPAIFPLALWQAPLLAGAILPLAYFARRGRRAPAALLLWGLLMAASAFFLMTDGSAWFWRSSVLLHNLQFPFRLLGPLALATAIATAGLLALARERLAARRLGPAVVAAGAVGLVAFAAAAGLPGLPTARLALAPEELTPAGMMRYEAALGQIGTDWVAPYLPKDVAVERGEVGRSAPPERTPPPGLPAGLRLTLGPRAPSRQTYYVVSPAPATLALHQFSFAGWGATVDGRPVETRAAGPLGLVSAPVPAGAHEVDFAFADSAPRRLGIGLSVLGGVLLLLLWTLNGPSRRARAIIALVPLAGLGLLAARPAAAGVTPLAVEARVGDVAALAGYRLEGTPLRAGGTLRLTLYWLALRAPERDYQVFVHLAEAADESRILAQHDGTPGYGYTPTSRWYPGEIIEDIHALQLPASVPSGRYLLAAGLYDLATVQPLPVAQPGASGSGRALLTTLESR
jgi:hypothetical protein